jgi:hypothetical protein
MAASRRRATAGRAGLGGAALPGRLRRLTDGGECYPLPEPACRFGGKRAQHRGSSGGSADAPPGSLPGGTPRLVAPVG